MLFSVCVQPVAAIKKTHIVAFTDRLIIAFLDAYIHDDGGHYVHLHEAQM